MKTEADLKVLDVCIDVYKDGTNAEQKYHFSTQEKIEEHIANFGFKLKSIKCLSYGEYRIYDDTDPHAYDTYHAELEDGTRFCIKRRYGRPLWYGNVAYENWLEATLLK
jgi:hypothetical protein